MVSLSIYLVFGLPLLALLLCYWVWQSLHNKNALQKIAQAKKDGLTEPASLHPVIDPNICLGCGTCVSACPEGEILGLVNRKAILVSPSSCIGHGACREACPTDAITLVFGTEKRGVEIPFLKPDFETSVAGIYIAGELGGMGLIRNAISQGQQAVEALAKNLTPKSKAAYDLVIVGAGPAGLSAALTAKKNGLRFVLLEQESIGGTVSHYPRGKIVMTQPAVLPLVGKFQFREASKEALVEFWNKAIEFIKSDIELDQQVERIDRNDNYFVVHADKGSFTTQSVLLALGRRGTPRKLGVPGEESSKVVYRMVDPLQYSDKKVLVVGGGDSALEAAVAISEQTGATTTLSYRNPAFNRAKSKNRENVEIAEREGRLQVLLKSNVKEITKHTAMIDVGDEICEIPNDHVIVCAGGILPTPFLKNIGINVEEKFGTA